MIIDFIQALKHLVQYYPQMDNKCCIPKSFAVITDMAQLSTENFEFGINCNDHRKYFYSIGGNIIKYPCVFLIEQRLSTTISQRNNTGFNKFKIFDVLPLLNRTNITTCYTYQICVVDTIKDICDCNNTTQCSCRHKITIEDNCLTILYNVLNLLQTVSSFQVTQLREMYAPYDLLPSPVQISLFNVSLSYLTYLYSKGIIDVDITDIAPANSSYKKLIQSIVPYSDDDNTGRLDLTRSEDYNPNRQESTISSNLLAGSVFTFNICEDKCIKITDIEPANENCGIYNCC